MDLSSHRENFPVLCEENPVAYLDNACVTLRPQSVIDAIADYYTKTPGCGGRSVHRYGTAVSKTISRSRKTLQGFFNAPSVNEIVNNNVDDNVNDLVDVLIWLPLKITVNRIVNNIVNKVIFCVFLLFGLF